MRQSLADRACAAGLADLDHELDRCATGLPDTLVIARADVVGLPYVNDRERHDAGDRLINASQRSLP